MWFTSKIIMWTDMVQVFASLGYLILLVGPGFFPIWYFSLPLFPSSSRIQRDPNSVSDGLLLVLVAIGWALSLPLLGPWLQPKCPYTLIPACRAAPVTLSGVVPATGLSLPLGQCGHPVTGAVHLLVFGAACGVWTTALPAAVGGLPLPLHAFVSSCSVLAPQPDVLVCSYFPNPCWLIPLQGTG